MISLQSLFLMYILLAVDFELVLQYLSVLYQVLIHPIHPSNRNRIQIYTIYVYRNKKSGMIFTPFLPLSKQASNLTHFPMGELPEFPLYLFFYQVSSVSIFLARLTHFCASNTPIFKTKHEVA